MGLKIDEWKPSHGQKAKYQGKEKRERNGAGMIFGYPYRIITIISNLTSYQPHSFVKKGGILNCAPKD
jgi:hypothetical protein